MSRANRALGKVFTVSPCFRAEGSQTRRHLSEFTMLEVEESFVDTVEQLMDRAEHLCRSVASHILDKHAEDALNVRKYVSPKGYKSHEKLVHPKRYLR